MPKRPSETELAASLSAAGATHHEYESIFLAGIRDEQWPGFYAAFVLGDLGSFTTPTLLASWLRDSPNADEWATSAARYVSERLS